MGAFDFVVVLFSFVYALAMTHVLSRAGGLLLARKRVAFSGLQALAMLNALLLVYLDWLTTWDTKTLPDWDLISISLFFFLAVLNYLVCVAAAPDPPSEGTIDLGDFYWENRLLFWGLIVGLNLLAFPANSVFGRSQSPQLVLQTNLYTLLWFAPCVLAITLRARWAQWLAGACLSALSIGWLVVFNSDLR
jgi:hypothetical protein